MSSAAPAAKRVRTSGAAAPQATSATHAAPAPHAFPAPHGRYLVVAVPSVLVQLVCKERAEEVALGSLALHAQWAPLGSCTRPSTGAEHRRGRPPPLLAWPRCRASRSVSNPMYRLMTSSFSHCPCPMHAMSLRLSSMLVPLWFTSTSDTSPAGAAKNQDWHAPLATGHGWQGNRALTSKRRVVLVVALGRQLVQGPPTAGQAVGASSSFCHALAGSPCPHHHTG